jgi:outer membrane lipopolysaccharide assembly protein LptE/RlpB
MALAILLLSGLLTITTGCGWLLLRLRPRSFAVRLRFSSWIVFEVEMSRPEQSDTS